MMNGNDIFQLIGMGFIGMFILTMVFIFLYGLWVDMKRRFQTRFYNGLDNPNRLVRKAYVMKLDDEDILRNVILNDKEDEVKLAALDKIDNPLILKEVIENDDGIVSRIARRKLKTH